MKSTLSYLVDTPTFMTVTTWHDCFLIIGFGFLLKTCNLEKEDSKLPFQPSKFTQIISRYNEYTA